MPLRYYVKQKRSVYNGDLSAHSLVWQFYRSGKECNTKHIGTKSLSNKTQTKANLDQQIS